MPLLISSDLSIVRSRNALSLCDRKSDLSTRASAWAKVSLSSLRMPNWSSWKSYTPLSDDRPSALAAAVVRSAASLVKSLLASMNVVPLCGAAMAVSEWTQSPLPPRKNGLGSTPAAFAAATSSGQPLVRISRNRRVVAPPKLWPTRFTARSVPQPSNSGVS